MLCFADEQVIIVQDVQDYEKGNVEINYDETEYNNLKQNPTIDDNTKITQKRDIDEEIKNILRQTRYGIKTSTRKQNIIFFIQNSEAYGPEVWIQTKRSETS